MTASSSLLVYHRLSLLLSNMFIWLLTGKDNTFTYLFWEATRNFPFYFDMKSCYCVPRESSSTFLHNALSQRGLLRLIITITINPFNITLPIHPHGLSSDRCFADRR